nr:dephospho-CoA kinase [Veillonella denticariosi]
MMDEVWLVYVNETTQVQRLMERNGYSRSDAMARIHSQMKLDDKRSYATIIIDNNGAPHELEKQLQSIWSTRIEPVLKPFE